MLVLKFGGTSVGTPEAIGKIIDILKDGEHRDRVRVVVVSAFSKVTDSLISMSLKAASGDGAYREAAESLKKRHLETAGAFLSGEALEKASLALDDAILELVRVLDGIAALKEFSPRTQDLVMSFGERLSASLIAPIFSSRGIPASYLDARPLIKTDRVFGKANYFIEETSGRIRSYFNSLSLKLPMDAGAAKAKAPIQVATGFISSTMDDTTSTLGRGGSDLTAAIIGAALDAEEVEIWTDVDGILTADPRQVKNSFRIESISYEEAMELSHFGAKVIYPPTIRPALEKGIPIRIKNTFNPACPGTSIVKDASQGPFPIRGISSMSGMALLRVQGSGMVGVRGFSARLFTAIARKGININLITQSSSEYSLCFAVIPEDAEIACEAVKEEFRTEIAAGHIEPPIAETDLSIVAVVGAKMKHSSGVSGKVFHALGRNGINVVAIAQGSSELNISAVISKQDEAKALNAIHEVFFLSGVRSVNLFLLGTGLIGGTLLEQIAAQREILADQHKIKINLVGAGDSKHMMLSQSGLDPKSIKAQLREGKEALDLQAFVSKMKAMNLPNTCFCDCTASDEVAGWYAEILQSSIPIVTPNKRANAGSLGYYKTLTGFSRERGIPYLYETTVCAGLPVISTLRDLFLSGDKVRRIEAVLSGTLSYIFNNYDGSKPFSALVREAKAKGYTEPDPRDDLNAMDAARKALILARECGLSLEFPAVDIEPILPPSCFKADNVEAFFSELEKSDRDFEKRRAAAEAEGKSLRYVAIIEEGAAKLSLRAEAPGSPFLSLIDSDNIVVISSDRYSSLPMVIKGPGAGAQVTAGGVFADIVRIARTLV
ncbi:bifunctional aspartate kinase/homoserine dehydrogenase I [Leadbettera azotonutricia]|uniref:Bifunctional aspartokinase/homoserine dehydrogenase I n=1 Tax=Leadbettera azotonutricia (strain ATCC BAA-888 / DSM 13862 / ZAS-9) TaxID=545695 RepID=F5YCA8_LEAAZ|nr:bifunctional aspartate kinase/homoserine dehydrogenase I [Leadbettera azotonutricia]AEF83306.1 bifunctional aspartokinase/homoserine dehydrogenase I [Leadbettera azotonutricia ZAS-9]